MRELVEKVIAEREVRREIVNRDPAVSEEEQRANMAVWRVLGYEERVVEKDEEGVGEWDVEASCSEEWAGRV